MAIAEDNVIYTIIMIVAIGLLAGFLLWTFSPYIITWAQNWAGTVSPIDSKDMYLDYSDELAAGDAASGCIPVGNIGDLPADTSSLLSAVISPAYYLLDKGGYVRKVTDSRDFYLVNGNNAVKVEGIGIYQDTKKLIRLEYISKNWRDFPIGHFVQGTITGYQTLKIYSTSYFDNDILSRISYEDLLKIDDSILVQGTILCKPKEYRQTLKYGTWGYLDGNQIIFRINNAYYDTNMYLEKTPDLRNSNVEGMQIYIFEDGALWFNKKHFVGKIYQGKIVFYPPFGNFGEDYLRLKKYLPKEIQTNAREVITKLNSADIGLKELNIYEGEELMKKYIIYRKDLPVIPPATITPI